MRLVNLFVAGALGVLTVTAVLAQQPQPGQAAPAAPRAPRTRTNVVLPTQPAKITVGARGAEASIYLTVQATNSDVRTTLTEMAEKAGLRLLLAPSATGAISGTVTDQPAETAITEVAKLGGLTVRRIAVPKTSATALTPETAGRYAEALTSLPVGAVVTDPATGKSLSVAAAAPAAPSDSETVLYVQGRFSPDQERAQRAANAARAAQPLAPANQDFVNRTAEALKQMPLQQRMEMMNALRRQMFEGMSEEERAAMRGMGGPGGPGGWGRGDRGNRGDRGGRGGQNQ